MNKKDHEEELKRLKAELEQVLKQSMDGMSLEGMSLEQKHEWLRHLHTRYSERFIKDNDRIWAIGHIFIPLSLAGLIGVPRATDYTIVPLALGSVLIMFFWVVFAEHHRGFQNYSLEVVKTIERYINLPIRGGKVNGHWITRIINVQGMRWIMFWAVVIIWALAVYPFFSGN